MRISAGILGYGEGMRFRGLLAQLQADPNINEILLHWNGAPNFAQRAISDLCKQLSKLRVKLDARNLGSAGGYAQLIKWFRDESCSELLWLLDDDAIPSQDCSSRLVRALRSQEYDPTRTLMMSFRSDLPEFVALRNGAGDVTEPRNGICVGLHLGNLFWKPKRSPDKPNALCLQSSPYGGLVIPRAALALLGLPDEELFLYGDDTALTLRFTRNGGAIRLCQDAEIRDKEPVWNSVGGTTTNMYRRVLYLDDTKAYYETRNRCYLGLTFYPGHRATYLTNRACFLAYAFLIAVRHRRLSRFRLLLSAIRSGEQMARRPDEQRHSA